MVSGRDHGKDSRGLGPWGWSAHAPPHLLPLPMDQSQEALQSGGGYCLSAGPELCSIQALFLAPGGRGKESKERSCCSRRNLGLEMIPGPAGPEKAVTVGSKDPELKRSWQGAGVRGSQRRAQMGQPWPFAHTCYPLIAATCRERGSASWVPPIVAKHLSQ